MAQSHQSREPALAEAVVDIAHSAQRIVEERIELLRLEVRKDMRRILRASALGVSGVVALAVAVGMAAGSITWTLALWMPFGAALGITAVLTAVAGIVLSRKARSSFADGEQEAVVERESTKGALAGSESRKALRPGHDLHDAEAST